ncbi:hypothetical protein MAR_012326 [Mya arenaria]|uniref:Myb/SANT-like DNA-binding domain-containing protein n=1 Tax=Mya arenaria TaxID=6604 RepID=A0ABY7FZZ5_MYAAR|nr:hypothetical protein MAR_012326 [Mya arenaria]
MNELKKRSNNWTNSERHSALSTILNQHDSLFGKFKGATLGNKAKEAKWDEIVMEINSCGGTRRTVEEVRKMYQSSKQRDKLKDTHVLTGIAGGVESGSYSFIIENDHDSSQPETGACSRNNENHTYEVPCVFAEKMQRKCF